MKTEKSRGKVEVTIFFISILILIRISCYQIEQILYIVYMLNVASMLFVVIQLFRNVYIEVSAGVKQHSLNTVIARRNKKIKRCFAWIVGALIVTLTIVGAILYACSLETAVSVINDVIALVALGLSIEDEKLYEYVVDKCR